MSRPFFHLIAVTETKLGDVVDDSLVTLEGYNLFRYDGNTRGGGITLYIYNTLSNTRLCSSATCQSGKSGLPEYLFCKVNAPTTAPFFVGVVYRPPHAPFVAHSQIVPDLTIYMHNYSTKVIFGDFNVDLLSNSIFYDQRQLSVLHSFWTYPSYEHFGYLVRSLFSGRK